MSHAATVSVQTKKYLCALRCGGKLSEGGRRSVMSAMALCLDDSVSPAWSTRDACRSREGQRTRGVDGSRRRRMGREEGRRSI